MKFVSAYFGQKQHHSFFWNLIISKTLSSTPHSIIKAKKSTWENSVFSQEFLVFRRFVQCAFISFNCIFSTISSFSKYSSSIKFFCHIFTRILCVSVFFHSISFRLPALVRYIAYNWLWLRARQLFFLHCLLWIWNECMQ